MKFRKFASLALAGAMALSLSVPAFASGGTTDPLKKTFDIGGTTKTPIIAIEAPTTGAVVVNPYKMEVLPTGGTAGTDEVTDQIISATQWVLNKSDVAVKTTVTLTGKVEGNTKLNATTTKNTTKPLTTNSVYLVFESTITDDGTTDVTWTGDGAVTEANKKTIVVAAKGTATDLGTLAAGTGTAIADAGGCLAFHLTGDAVETPTVAWAATDKVSVGVAFTFTPTVVAPTTGG